MRNSKKLITRLFALRSAVLSLFVEIKNIGTHSERTKKIFFGSKITLSRLKQSIITT